MFHFLQKFELMYACYDWQAALDSGSFRRESAVYLNVGRPMVANLGEMGN
jgi:hypothetical protein